MGANLQSILAAVGVVLTPFITWWVGRQDRNDKRTAIMRDLEILRAINPESVEHKRLETQVRKSLSNFLEERQRKEETAPLFRRYYAFLTFAGIFLALTWVASQGWLHDSWASSLTAARVAAAAIAISFVANILWILVKLSFAIARAGALWILLQYHKLRKWFAEAKLDREIVKRDRLRRERDRLLKERDRLRGEGPAAGHLLTDTQE